MTDTRVDPFWASFNDAYVVCPGCDEIVPRKEANEHVCPIEEDLEADGAL